MKYNHTKKHLKEILFNLRVNTLYMSGLSKVRYYLFSIKWLYKNRNWQNNKKKFKALDKAYWAYVYR